MVFEEIINQGINNPECSFFVGTFIGQTLSLRIMLFLSMIYLLIKAIDKLAFTPLLNKIKSKLYGKKKFMVRRNKPGKDGF